jgi:hypothetical protein
MDADDMREKREKRTKIALWLLYLASAMILFTAGASAAVIVNPLSDTVLVGTVIAEVIALDNTSIVEFYLTNTTGDYALDGAPGSTNDTFGTDGWKQAITLANFGEGSYNLTVKSYARGVSQYEFTSSGNETNLTIDRTDPTGSVVIYGSNGTAETGARNVHLNLTYADDVGVDKCRFANDDQSNLASAVWEACTTVKAWTLSEGYANKTVYFEVKDMGGNTAVYNDSITYKFILDFTAPTAPTVYDGATGEDIDWWNSNTTLHARWYNATEDLSTIYYKYRIWVNNTAPMTSYVDVGTETEVTVTGLVLNESWLYSFEVEAYNMNNLTASNTSDGVRIDLTVPEMSGINSSSHPDQSVWYALATVLLNWSANDPVSYGNASGVEGYSYMIDKKPYTMPDEEVEGYTEEVVQYEPSIKNASNVFLAAGASEARSVYSQGSGNLSYGDRVLVDVRMYENASETTDILTYEVFIIKKPAGTGEGGFSFDDKTTLISNIAYESRDIAYASAAEYAKEYSVELTINDTLGTEDWYVVLVPNVSDVDNTNSYYGSGTDTLSAVDNTTNVFICVYTVACVDRTDAVDLSVAITRFNVRSETQYVLPDGRYYFHARAKDYADNWGLPSHYNITIYGGGGVDVEVLSPYDGEVFVSNASSYNISVEVGVGSNSSVQVVVLHPGGGNYTSPAVPLNSSNNYEYEFTDVTLEQGVNEIYAVANNTYGILTTSPSVEVALTGAVQPVTNRTLRVVYSGATNPQSYLTYSDESGTYVGMATERGSAVGSGYLQSDTSDNTIKIFMTKQFDVPGIDAQLGDDEFLDELNPSFAYYSGLGTGYVIRHELRFRDIHLGGGFVLPPGKYNVYLRKSGETIGGQANVTLVVR